MRLYRSLLKRGVLHRVGPRGCAAFFRAYLAGDRVLRRAMLRRLLKEARSRNLKSAVLTFEPSPQEYFLAERAPASRFLYELQRRSLTGENKLLLSQKVKGV